MTYRLCLDPDSVRAVDTHVHIQVDDSGRTALPLAFIEAMDRYFGQSEPIRTVDETAEYFRERRVAAVVFTVDATTHLGQAPNSIDDLVAGAERNADILIPFGSVDPLQGESAVDEARRQADDLGVRGFKFHPTVQGFDPSAPEFVPLFSAIEELGLPSSCIPGRPGWVPGCQAAWASDWDCRTRCCSTTWPPATQSCRS